MAKLRVGLIGCGGIMGAHARGFDRMDGIDIVAVADPIGERRAAMAARYGAKGVYADHNALYDAEKDLDALVIAVPPDQHKGIEEEAVARKWPFKVEKPMTLDRAQAHRLSDAIQKAGLVTAVGFQGRYGEINRYVTDALANMRVGFVNTSRAGGIPQVPWWRKKAGGGGQLIEMSIHQVDMIHYFFGDFDTVYAVSGRGIVDPDADCPGYDVEDFSVVTFTMASGVVATLHSCNYMIGEGVGVYNGMAITGREMSIDFQMLSKARLLTQRNEITYINKNDGMYDSDVAFFDAVRRADPKGVLSPYSDGLKTLDACFAAYESMAAGKPVSVAPR